MLDSLVVDVGERMLLFVVVREGESLEEARGANPRSGCGSTARRGTCPTPSTQIAEVPRTLSNKKLEVPVKKILIGGDPEKAASRDSLENPEALDWFVERAADLSPQPR